TGREIRFVLMSAHYRETFNFTLEGLQGAKTALNRLDECLHKLKEVTGESKASGSSDLPARFEKAMDDDLNVSAAWAAVFEWVRQMNRQMAESALSSEAAAAELHGWGRVNTVLGIELKEEAEAIPAEVLSLAEQRLTARKSKDFAEADRIRDALKAMGWVIEDTPQGPRPKKT
ncbi:cysteine--tRNA ligase, partial [Verrucomicrobia bacterium]|nr:cysteine--tRNA ligase [Verrucomicrobiota bacterium]